MDNMGKVDWGFSAEAKARDLENRVAMLETILRDLIEAAINSEQVPDRRGRLRKLYEAVGGR